MKQRQLYLDAAKGIGMLLIVLAHIGHSMWIMCAHHLIYRPIKLIIDKIGIVDTSNLVVFALTLAICCATAPLVDKYIPAIIGASKKK